MENSFIRIMTGVAGINKREIKVRGLENNLRIFYNL